ncbi:MAG: DUF1553 domain-containing protein [Saprospiraceae bacterium]|nr:DUF1553 domain-containing protein [Saprospiraceae bacterium]
MFNPFGTNFYLVPLVATILLVTACQSIVPDEVAQAYEEIPDQVDYNFHVKPILSDRCFKCHGPDANQRKGDLRLDTPEGLFQKTTNESSVATAVIDPGSLQGSEFVRRILSSDPDYVMPTTTSNLSLDAREKAILLRWIEQGAEYKEHWSFTPPQMPTIPEVGKEDWAKNDIDLFILKDLEKHQLSPSTQTDGHTLLRRIALDLTGLPPTPKEQADLISSDNQLQDIASVIDYYQSKPEYGEKMALGWMDVGRYADSHGYQDDGMRNTWPWRDWVIDQFNHNLRYDTFLLWQLAGDLLPNPSEEQLLATCFNRNHPQTQEGGVVDEEYRVEYVADRTNTLGKGILGLTMECARCHDHKYDPISQKDYYSLYAFFNNNNDAGIVPYNGEASPTLILPNDQDKDRLTDLHQQIVKLEDSLQLTDKYLKDFKDWYTALPSDVTSKIAELPGMVADFSFEKEVKQDKYSIYLDKGLPPTRPPGAKPSFVYTFSNKVKQKQDAQNWGHPDDRPQVVPDGHTGSGLLFNGDAGVRFNRDLDYDRDQPFSVSVWVKFLKAGEEGPIFGKTNGDFEGYRGWLCKLNPDGTLSFQLNHVWPDNCIDYQTTEPVAINQWMHIVMTYDGSSRAAGVHFYVDGKTPANILHADHLKKSLLHGVKGSNWSNQPFLLGMELRKSMENMVLDELKIFDRPLVPYEIQYIYAGTVPEKKNQEEWFNYYLLSGRNKHFNQLQRQLQDVRRQENLLMTDQPEVMVMHEKKFPRESYILNRGAYDAHADTVHPAIPEAFRGKEPLSSPDRLGLAKWVIAPDNPLTARVEVNRLWLQCFGKGIVSTQEDFGSQGDLPTHPELLDYLTLRFIDLDWNVKALLKEIMMSATYQQSSVVSAEAQKNDPENRYYSHYPAHRLKAEIIRDEALAASGLLVKKIGGPSVYPYQPEGIWEALATRNATSYHQQTGDNLYRRSLYTIWKRSSPPPAMLNFDAPDRYYCVVRRQNTSTPLQALVLMNDPQFIEAARILGEKMAKQDNPEQAIDLAFESLLAREPRKDEMVNMVQMWEELEQDFEHNKSSAADILEIGDSETDKTLDQNTLAAYSMLASAIMNFEEFVIKR